MPYELRSLIAQTLLSERGFYRGKLDGEWGPLSIAAANAWDDGEVVKAIPMATGTKVPGAPTPYELALKYIGTKEIPGVKDNPRIVQWGRRLVTWFADDETAWCSAFANAMAQDAGYERSGKLNARSWLDVGLRVAAENVRPGDVVIFWRNSPDSWEGHVGFVDSLNIANKTVRVLGGNQSDSVSIAEFPTSKVLGYRRLRSLDALQGKSSSLV